MRRRTTLCREVEEERVWRCQMLRERDAHIGNCFHHSRVGDESLLNNFYHEGVRERGRECEGGARVGGDPLSVMQEKRWCERGYPLVREAHER